MWTHVIREDICGRDSPYQTVFHIEVSVKGLVIIDDLPALDQKPVTLTETNEDGISFLQAHFFNDVP